MEIVHGTARANIRRITDSDLEAMMSVYGDAELMRFVGDGSPIKLEDCRHWIQITQAHYERRGYGLFLVESAESRESIGFIGITHPGDQPDPEIKYVLRQQFWGKGLAKELVAGLCAHARSEWGLENIVATVHPDNAISLRVLASCGFKRVADRVEQDSSATTVWEWHETGV